MKKLSCSETLPVTSRATAAGTNVSDRMLAPVNAISTVKAIGVNIFPSTPVSVRIGRYTTAIMNVPNRLGRITSRDPARMVSKRSWRSSTRPSRCCSVASRRRQFSTMMTAPSMMMPKSMAPRLIRLALTLFATMPVMVNSMDSGITHAVAIAALKLPRIKNRTTITRRAPSMRFLWTVATVASTRRARS